VPHPGDLQLEQFGGGGQPVRGGGLGELGPKEGDGGEDGVGPLLAADGRAA
jgi:hypothetical protein